MLLSNRIALRSYHTESCSHSHDFAQLILPISGSMELEVGHYCGIVNQDTGVYIAANEQHCFAGSQQNVFLVLDLTTKNTIYDQKLTSNHVNLTSSIKKLIQFTQHYLTHQAKDFFADSLINQLLVHFAVGAFTPQPDPLVMKAKSWLDFNVTEPVDVSRVARHCCLSISQLQRRFKQAMDCSLGEYWRMKKLFHAKELLCQRNYSIEAIAFALGYENVSAFSRRFSKLFGESPSQWRSKAFNSKEYARKG